MMNRIVIKQTISECLLHPLFLFAVIVEFVLTSLLIFAIGFQYADGVLVSLRFLGGTIRDDVQVMVYSLASTSFTLTSSILMFLFILLTSSFYPDLLKNPLLGIMLTKRLSRTQFYLSKFAGLMILLSADVLLFSLVLSSVLAAKTDGLMPVSLIVGGVSFCAELLSLFALSAFLTMVVDHSFGIAVIVAAVYYLVGPLVADADLPDRFSRVVVSLLVPPIGILNRATRGIVLGEVVNYAPLLAVFPYAVFYLTAGTFLFHRKDLK